MTDDTPIGIVMEFCRACGPNHLLYVHPHVNGFGASIGTHENHWSGPFETGATPTAAMTALASTVSGKTQCSHCRGSGIGNEVSA